MTNKWIVIATVAVAAKIWFKNHLNCCMKFGFFICGSYNRTLPLFQLHCHHLFQPFYHGFIPPRLSFFFHFLPLHISDPAVCFYSIRCIDSLIHLFHTHHINKIYSYEKWRWQSECAWERKRERERESAKKKNYMYETDNYN